MLLFSCNAKHNKIIEVQLLHDINVYNVNPFMPTGAFNICCPRDCISRHNRGTAGAPLKPLRDDSALRHSRCKKLLSV